MRSSTHNIFSRIFNPYKPDLFYNSIYFFKKHLAVLLSLGLIASMGRVIQVGGFGSVPAWFNLLLELVIESARLTIFLYVLGFANLVSGIRLFRTFLVSHNKRKSYWKQAMRFLKSNWLKCFFSVFAFLLAAWIINFLINQLAYQTCLYISLKEHGWINKTASEWTIILFFKNISVIPLTLVFYGIFFLWVSGKRMIEKKIENKN